MNTNQTPNYQKTPTHFFVGSANPAKNKAVRQAVVKTWPEAIIKGHDVGSGIPDQPMGDEETRRGAINRACRALEWGRTTETLTDEQLGLGIGLEGGVLQWGTELWSTVWVAVTDGQVTTTANGARMQIPEVVARPLLEGKEMGPVVAEFVGEEDVRSKQGYIGVITHNFVTRAEEYGNIARMAIGLWYGYGWEERLS